MTGQGKPDWVQPEPPGDPRKDGAGASGSPQQRGPRQTEPRADTRGDEPPAPGSRKRSTDTGPDSRSKVEGASLAAVREAPAGPGPRSPRAGRTEGGPAQAAAGKKRNPPSPAHSLLSAEAIDEELERLKMTSKVRRRQLKELRKAGALLGDVLARGFLTAYLLHLCDERPRHGNEILQEIEARTDSLWAPSSGGVYTILRKLEKRGLLEGSWEAGVTRERRVYRVTEQGRDTLDEFRRLAPPRIAAASHVLEVVARDLLEKPARDRRA